MGSVITLFVGTFGLLCICVGYQLFCELPTGRRSRMAVVALNLVPGALLALFGTGVLTAEAVTLLRPHHSFAGKPSRESTVLPLRSTR